MIDDKDIRVVLDRSAIESYAAGHVHVGETIGEVANGKGYTGVPAVALAEAYGRAGDGVSRARLGVLPRADNVVVFQVGEKEAPDVGDVLRFAEGDVARAQAVYLVLAHEACLLTAEPKKVSRMLADDVVIVVPEEEA
jgi:hypothetical protein